MSDDATIKKNIGMECRWTDQSQGVFDEWLIRNKKKKKKRNIYIDSR